MIYGDEIIQVQEECMANMRYIHLLVIPDASIVTIASSPLVALISRLASPNNAKNDEKAQDP
jgi:hypothetical protein